MTDKTIQIDGDVVYLKSLKSIDKGEYFKRKPESKTIYTKGSYDRSEKNISVTMRVIFLNVFISKAIH